MNTGTTTRGDFNSERDILNLPDATEDAVTDLLESADTTTNDTPHQDAPAAPAETDCATDAGPVRPWWLDDLDDGSTTDDSTGTGVGTTNPIAAEIDLTDGHPVARAPRPDRPRMLIRVLGVPRIVDGPELDHRQLNVVAFVACSPRPVNHEHIQDAIWGGKAIARKSVFNLIGRTRSALGKWDDVPILSDAKGPYNTITVHPDVRTDLDLLRELVATAEAAPSHEALDLLAEALELVEGPPFDHPGYDWAITNQLVSDAEHLVHQAATTAAELALNAADLDTGRRAITIGLRAIPGDETLYRHRMRLEAAAGNHAAVKRSFHELACHLDQYGATPGAQTVAVLHGTAA